MLASADKREETLKKYVFLMVFRYLSEPRTPDWRDSAEKCITFENTCTKCHFD